MADKKQADNLKGGKESKSRAWKMGFSGAKAQDTPRLKNQQGRRSRGSIGRQLGIFVSKNRRKGVSIHHGAAVMVQWERRALRFNAKADWWDFHYIDTTIRAKNEGLAGCADASKNKPQAKILGIEKNHDRKGNKNTQSSEAVLVFFLYQCAYTQKQRRRRQQ